MTVPIQFAVWEAPLHVGQIDPQRCVTVCKLCLRTPCRCSNGKEGADNDADFDALPLRLALDGRINRALFQNVHLPAGLGFPACAVCTA
jgi:hypothetical protein